MEYRDLEHQLQQGLEQLDWLVPRHPYVSQYAAGRAQLCHKLSVIQRRTGRTEEAEQYSRRAVEEMMMLADQNPETATYVI